VSKRPQYPISQPATILVARKPRRKTKQIGNHPTGITLPWLKRQMAFLGLLKRTENYSGPLQRHSVIGLQNEWWYLRLLWGGTNSGPSYFLSPATNIIHKSGPCSSVPQCNTVCGTQVRTHMSLWVTREEEDKIHFNWQVFDSDV